MSCVDFTSHQKRMAALKEQIAALEAENVAPKKWTLSGEVNARNRPQNSLLEEDLDFERVMKPVPVVVEEVVQEVEEMIKSRILANSYDDVVRRRPLDEKPFLPSKLIHLQDTKSAQSLAEIYEDEYSAARNGGVAGEDRDGKLAKEREEMERQWEKICAKLDALCNAHFTPKQVSHSINYVLDDTSLQAFTITAGGDHSERRQRFRHVSGIGIANIAIRLDDARTRGGFSTVFEGAPLAQRDDTCGEAGAKEQRAQEAAENARAIEQGS